MKLVVKKCQIVRAIRYFPKLIEEMEYFYTSKRVKNDISLEVLKDKKVL